MRRLAEAELLSASGVQDAERAALAATRRTYLLIFLAVVIGITLVLTLLLNAVYQQTERTAVAHAQNVSTALMERIDASLRRIEATFDAFESILPDDALSIQAVPRYRHRLDEFLKTSAFNFPEIVAFRVIDASGIQLYRSDDAIPPSFSGRPAFEEPMKHPGIRMHYGDVVIGHVSKRPALVVSRPLIDSTKKFRVLLTASLDLAYFTELFAALDLGPNGIISLRHTNARLMARWPERPDLINKPISDPTQDLIDAGKWGGVVHLKSWSDGGGRLFYIRKAKIYPFAVTVGLASDDYLADWRKLVAFSIFASILILATLAYFFLRLWRTHLYEWKLMAGLQQAKERTDTATRAKSQFLASVSHELRTPLNAILGFSESMSHETFGPLGHPRYREYLTHIHDSGKHLLNLINDILDISAIESGKLELHESKVNLKKVLDDCAAMIQPQADKNKVTVTQSLNDGALFIRADDRRFRQIILNLLSNAVKFTEVGGNVTLFAQTDSFGNPRIEISDTGIGMTEAEIAKAITPFGQVDSGIARNVEGTGLGLSLTIDLVKMHGGTLDIKSAKGKGTQITVILPKERIAADDIPLGSRP